MLRYAVFGIACAQYSITRYTTESQNRGPCFCLRRLENTSRNYSYRRSSSTFNFSTFYLQSLHHGTSCSVAGGAAASPCMFIPLSSECPSLTSRRSLASTQKLSPTSPPQTSPVTGPESRTHGHLTPSRRYVFVTMQTNSQCAPHSHGAQTELQSRVPPQ